jgi:hypothetical protein
MKSDYVRWPLIIAMVALVAESKAGDEMPDVQSHTSLTMLLPKKPFALLFGVDSVESMPPILLQEINLKDMDDRRCVSARYQPFLPLLR